MVREYIHIIEYSQRGPLWNLMDGVTCYDNHHVLETKGKFVDLDRYPAEDVFVFHTTGKNFPMINSLQLFLEKGKCCVVFIHTLPDYIIDKGFSDFMPFISKTQKKYGYKALVPSTMASQMFYEYGIRCEAVNLGIRAIEFAGHSKGLEKYFNRIITVSTKNTDEYMLAKGVDRFCQLMRTVGMESCALILGTNAGQDTGIESIRLTHQDFLYVLSHARAYVQLSRSESYNISVIEAKQLMIPVLVSDSTGHKDSVRNTNCRVDSFDDAISKLLEILKRGPKVEAWVRDNYRCSIRDESIGAFRNRIESVIEG